VARMIPPVIDPATASPGEREIFRRLKDDPLSSDWIVLHSLAISHHQRQISGEVDFLIIVPLRGVLGLEVKACSQLRRDGGLWYYGDEAADPRGPFKQAAEGMHAARRRVVDKDASLKRVLFWSAVCFPYVPFKVDSDEWHPWQVIDAMTFRSRPLAESVFRVFDEARNFLTTRESARWFRPDSGEPGASQCEAIAQALRPDFEFFESAKARAGRRDDELKRYTAEQFLALDAMEVNPRVTFFGPAGTGKTLLAMESARRASASGERTLLLCYNRLLGSWLKNQMAGVPGPLTVGTLHGYLLERARLTPPAEAGADFWQRQLPDATLAALLNVGGEGEFDELIVDEAQDILRAQYLDVLDLSVKGGLAAGCWRLFGDFERQALFETDLTLEKFLATRGEGAPAFSLRINCRNTPRIASMVYLLAGLQPAYARILRADNGIEPELRYYSTKEAEVGLLVNTLGEMFRRGYAGSDIVVLSTRAADPVAESLPAGAWQDRVRPIELASFGQVRYGTVHAFKGLEAPVIILTDVAAIQDVRSQALFYVAITRATERIVCLVDERVKAEVIGTLTSPHVGKTVPIANA